MVRRDRPSKSTPSHYSVSLLNFINDNSKEVNSTKRLGCDSWLVRLKLIEKMWKNYATRKNKRKLSLSTAFLENQLEHGRAQFSRSFRNDAVEGGRSGCVIHRSSFDMVDVTRPIMKIYMIGASKRETHGWFVDKHDAFFFIRGTRRDRNAS